MNRQVQIEMLYNSKKKSKGMAYLLGALLGSFGAHYFVLGSNTLGFITLGLLVSVFVLPVLVPVQLIWVLWGVIHTSILADQINEEILLGCEGLIGE